jgi:hemoglobin
MNRSVSSLSSLGRLGLASMLVVIAAASHAQDAAADDSVYRAWGGKAGIRAVMEDFVPRLEADPRIGKFFKREGRDNLVAQLTDQLCKVSGGPCTYGGAPMDKVHQDLEAGPITKADFHALVEVLQASMQARGIAFSAQNRMLALLAPMHREIISKE